MPKPLEGIRVLDLTNVLAGPFCCHNLAHLGAEVIKVETVGRGDLARQLGADSELNAAGMGVSFLAQNAGKKSVTVNLKELKGKALFIKLVESADVIVENFRPGVMARLGVDYENLKSIKQTLIYCAISGFGQDGPWVHRAKGSAMLRREQWAAEGLEGLLPTLEGVRWAITAHLTGEVLGQRFEGRSRVYARRPDGAVAVLAEAPHIGGASAIVHAAVEDVREASAESVGSRGPRAGGGA